ncbi:MAG: TonB-dependent receptor [Bacteroidales bacterium]|jgi:TonB-linked SusC/RagA family outer membrane protein|nr:TonB-dependent receptor [Bacteroidales bacterium]
MKNKISYVMTLLLLLACYTLPAQQKPTFVMEGTVYDETGETMPGASVYLKDKIGIGAVTDITGKFSIRAAKGDVLVFSFVGYEKVEYPVTEEKKDLEIRLETAQQLEEVVVTGLGTQRKISSLAAVTSVDVKELQRPVASVANLLGGRVAGVISLQSSGEPGRNISEFWVRGIGTFGANASALVLIDGIEGNINSIDPADIESFSVLKDASATAVYGVRGANGVVLITTKRGSEDRLTITGRASFTVSHLTKLPSYLRAYDYARLANEALEVRGQSPLYSDVELDIIQDGSDPDIYPDVSWQDEVLRRVFFKQNYYLSARGGAKVAKYFLSLGGSSENAAYKYDKNNVYGANVGYNTYTYRANIDLELSPSTTFFLGTDGYLQVHNQPGVASTDYIWYAQAQITPLMFPVRYSNGQLPAADAGEMTSPEVMINNLGRRSDQEYRGKATMALNQDLSKFVEGLKFRIQGSYSLNSYFSEQRFHQPQLYLATGRDQQGKLLTNIRVRSQPSSYSRGTNQWRKYHLESTVNYDRVFSADHRVSGLAYYYMSDEKNANNGTTNLNSIPVRYQGISSRLTYGFRDTYMVDFNFGYTGSENFEPGKQFGFFPSIALGWAPSSYQYVKDNLKWVNFFKIRGSYGTVGNDRLAGNRRFPYMTLVNNPYSAGPWGMSSVEAVSENVIGADNLQWEKAVKADVGIEGKFLDNRLEFVVDFFNDQRNDIFMQRVHIPSYAGLVSNPYSNVGKMRSYGADGNVSYIQELGREMTVTFRGNFTYSKNHVQNWEEANPKYAYQEAAGYPLGVIRGYRALGLFRDQDDIDNSPVQSFGAVMPGDVKYRDVNGDGQINGDDATPLSYSMNPHLMYGFGGEFHYRHFTVGVLFKGTGKTDFFHVGYGGNGVGYMPFFDGQTGNSWTMAADPANRWIPREYAVTHGIDPALAENPNARFPRLQYSRNNNNVQLSDFWKGDARYLRLQEVSFNYNCKARVLNKIGVASIDFQLTGSNLFVWDRVVDVDPEQAWRNGEVYPIPATYTLQIYINL